MDNARVLTSGLKVVVVLGPTATGKTAMSLRIAEAFGGEIINADSRYLYRGMDIGTAKPSPEERGTIRHHLIDIREPFEPYSLATFLDDAFAAIEDVDRRAELPVVTGGTPQYLRALLEGWRVPHVEPDPELRAQLEMQDVSDLFARLQRVDALSAERIGATNKRRIIRALEVFDVTGRTMSELAGKQPPPYRFHIIGLFQPRAVLYPRIDTRVEQMYAAGWLEEVRSMRDSGIHAGMPSMSAHGYREALEVIDGQTSVADAMRRTRTLIHRYVRHQETWFRRFQDVYWYDSSNAEYEHAILRDVAHFLGGDRTVGT